MILNRIKLTMDLVKAFGMLNKLYKEITLRLYQQEMFLLVFFKSRLKS